MVANPIFTLCMAPMQANTLITHMSKLMVSPMAAVAARRCDLNPWRDADWPAIARYFGRPWLLPILGACSSMKEFIR